MPRPSVKAERTEEILQAYERCVARFGVEGATLEKIAAEAGMARPLLRHHVGNRDELLAQAVERFVRRSEASMQELEAAVPAGVTGEYLLELILPARPPKQAAGANDILIAGAFIYAAQDHAELKRAMQAWLKSFFKSFTAALRVIYPRAQEDALRCAATGIVGIWFNVDSLASLGANRQLREDSRRAAALLLKDL